VSVRSLPTYLGAYFLQARMRLKQEDTSLLMHGARPKRQLGWPTRFRLCGPKGQFRAGLLMSSDIIRGGIGAIYSPIPENSFLRKAYHYAQDCGMRVASQGYRVSLSGDRLSFRGREWSNRRSPAARLSVQSYNPMPRVSLARPTGLAVAQ